MWSEKLPDMSVMDTKVSQLHRLSFTLNLDPVVFFLQIP